MNIIEKNEGQKIPYSIDGSWLNFADQIMINLASREADYDVHIDISSDNAGNLGTGVGSYYVAQVDIPARQYTETEVENPDYDENEGESEKMIVTREAVPFDIDNVTLSLFALKEGVSYD